ncbi:hypothetical protein QJS04_geneDACA013731 [Acorus gramineus]|uniref:Uncharacterized protein n=1 Tax=Acorus gramineus TaxID=55184 RepID=A0AAV9AZW5_ACOGR|nr:hypothetical protein QJS04_geneDACA013731 [Acorus gramineus]
MLTSSYDGFIRLMDVREESFNVIYSSDDSIFSLAQQPLNTSVYFGEGEGYFMGWDQRAGKVSCSYKLHDERIDSIDFNTKNTNVMATCSADGTVCLWDLRRINAREPRKLKVHQHDNPVRSAYFSPSGNCLATTSGEYSVRVYNDDNVVEMPALGNDNQLGTWVSNIRAIWGWDDSYLFVGSSIKAYGIVSVPQKTITAIHSPQMNAIPRQFATHPYRHGNLACATGRGQVILWTSE